MEELLDSTTHISDSRSGVRRLKDLLRCGRDPGLLGELADHHLSTGSAGALEVLLSLRDFHAQVRSRNCVHTVNDSHAYIGTCMHT